MHFDMPHIVANVFIRGAGDILSGKHIQYHKFDRDQDKCLGRIFCMEKNLRDKWLLLPWDNVRTCLVRMCVVVDVVRWAQHAWQCWCRRCDNDDEDGVDDDDVDGDDDDDYGDGVVWLSE